MSYVVVLPCFPSFLSLFLIVLLLPLCFVGLFCCMCHCFKPVSQSCTVAKSEKFWRATAQSYLTYERLAATKASNVWFSYSHNCTHQRSSLPCYLPGLIVQRSAKIVHFSLLRMIVKWFIFCVFTLIVTVEIKVPWCA